MPFLSLNKLDKTTLKLNKIWRECWIVVDVFLAWEYVLSSSVDISKVLLVEHWPRLITSCSNSRSLSNSQRGILNETAKKYINPHWRNRNKDWSEKPQMSTITENKFTDVTKTGNGKRGTSTWNGIGRNEKWEQNLTWTLDPLVISFPILFCSHFSFSRSPFPLLVSCQINKTHASFKRTYGSSCTFSQMVLGSKISTFLWNIVWNRVHTFVLVRSWL